MTCNKIKEKDHRYLKIINKIIIYFMISFPLLIKVFLIYRNPIKKFIDFLQLFYLLYFWYLLSLVEFIHFGFYYSKQILPLSVIIFIKYDAHICFINDTKIKNDRIR